MTVSRRLTHRCTRPVFAAGIALSLVAACAKNDLAEPPVPLGEFALGLNIVVADKAEKVPISRDATPDEWEAVMKQAVADRFGRYKGNKLYNIGISVDGYALAPPGIPVVAAPKSVLVVTANVWDDAARKKLNAEGKQFTVFEGLSGETVIGTGLTRSKEQQMQALAFNAVKRVEGWFLENPEWFGMPADGVTTVATTAVTDAAAVAQPRPAASAAAVIGAGVPVVPAATGN